MAQLGPHLLKQHYTLLTNPLIKHMFINLVSKDGSRYLCEVNIGLIVVTLVNLAVEREGEGHVHNPNTLALKSSKANNKVGSDINFTLTQSSTSPTYCVFSI